MAAIYLIGDSTVDNFRPPFRGWGWSFPKFVKPGITVKNYALSGRSSRSFREEGLFAPVEKELAAGDLLLIQFGHNDEKDDEERHTDPATTYPATLWEDCRFALERGAQPVLITPVARRYFSGDHSILYTHGEYPAAVRRLAAEKGIPLVDLKAVSRALYLRLGPEKTAELFVRIAPGENPDYPEGHDDMTHFNAYGSGVIAELVARELKKIPECADFLI